MTPVQLSRTHFPVTALGPGQRWGVWFQGCDLGCHGCLSRDTWDTASGRSTTVEELLDGMAACGDAIDGVTISGGEPFQQPAALLALLAGCRQRLPNADLLCYSGLTLKRLQRDHAPVLSLLDALIPEPFVLRRPHGGAWRGSDNQPLLLLTDRARQRFADVPDHPQVQVAAGDGLHLIGVPQRGDLERLEASLAQKGITLVESSWT